MQLYLIIIAGIAGATTLLGLLNTVRSARQTCPACRTRIWIDHYCSRCGMRLEKSARPLRPRLSIQTYPTEQRQGQDRFPRPRAGRRPMPERVPPPAIDRERVVLPSVQRQPRPFGPSPHIRTWMSQFQFPSVKVITVTTCPICHSTITVGDHYCGQCGTRVILDVPAKHDE